jgi:hypothetical protein
MRRLQYVYGVALTVTITAAQLFHAAVQVDVVLSQRCAVADGAMCHYKICVISYNTRTQCNRVSS